MHSLLRSSSSVPRPTTNKFVRFLTKEELRSATNAFNRARGHFSCLQVDHFRDILLHEAFVAIPEYLIQIIFCEWNISNSGEISCSEFIAGIASAVKGSREDHLDLVFRMMSTHGDVKTATKADVVRFFNCFATSSGCVAIEQSKTLRSWTVDELLHEIFGRSTTVRTTFKKFRAVLGTGSSFSVLHLVDWIPTLAKRLLNMQRDDLLALSMPRAVTSFTVFEPYEGLATDQRDDLRFELRSILFTLATEPTVQQIGSIIDKIRDLVVDVHTIGDLLLSRVASEEPEQTMEPHVVDHVREEIKMFVLGLCCIQASSAHQVYRLLFELFDGFSRGQLDVDQLGVFLQLAKGLSPIDSEREASIIMRKRDRSQSSLPSPPASPSGSPLIYPEDQQVMTCSQFIKVAQQQPGFSFAEVESALLLLHLKRYSNSTMISGHDSVPLQHLFNCYFSEGTSQSNAFCVLSASEWQQIVASLLNCQPELVTNTSVQIIHEEARELPFGRVMIPLPVWFLVSFWLEMENKKTLSQRPGFDWVSTVQLHRDDQSYLHGYWLRVSLSLTSCDGFERNANFPQIIIFEQCTVQSIVDAVLLQKSWCGRGEDENFKVTTMCQCQVLIAERNSIGEIKALIHQEDPTILSPDQLAAPLRSVLSSICPSWVLDSLLRCEKLSFGIQISVVEFEELCEIEPPVLKHNDVSYDSPKYGYSFQQVLVSQPRNRVPRGLNNLGNTCFMNAVVQCLAATPPLSPHVFQEELQYNLPGSGNGLTQIGNKPLPLLLGELFSEMNRDKEKVTDATTSVSPTTLLKAFQDLSPHMADGNQQDAQEFLVCLLGHVGNALKRNPKQKTEPHILSPRSYDILTSIFRSKCLTSEDNVSTERKSLQLSIEDSNGRHDRVVATEWWVSHILNEPSVTNILFSGQFKSSLACEHCHHQSARFEPFSSLQLPVIECNTSSTSMRNDQQDLVVIVHSQSAGGLTGGHGPVRTVVQIEESSTVVDILAQITMSEANSTEPQYVIGDLGQFTIQNLLVTDSMEDQLDDKTPATALSNPVHAFETFNIPGVGDDTASPVAESPRLYLRFVHRQNFLVPFYFSTPIRQTLCGSPFVGVSKRGGLTGQSLHQMVLHKFLLGHSTRLKSRLSSTEKIKRRSEKHAPNFVLRRVRDDGVACSRCHWTTNCLGCPILPTTTAADLLDLENCETLAIDWDLLDHPQDQSAFWWLQSYAARDHPSYVHYRRTKTHSLMQSLQSLCSTDHLDANCSNCQQQNPLTLTPHTKQLSLWSLPPILVLQLKRFDLIAINGKYQWNKLTHSVDFPIHNLDLVDLLAAVEGAHSDSEPCSDRCSKDQLDPRVRRGITFLQNELHISLTSASRSCTKYDLYAVVNHSGSGMSSGHYTAHIRPMDETWWWLADDAKVSPLHEHQLSPSSTAYLLFYVRQDIATGTTELEDLFPCRSTM